MSILNHVHITKDGEEIHVLSMTHSHLTTMVRLLLVKHVNEAVTKFMHLQMGQFAPIGLSSKQVMALGLPTATEQQIDNIEHAAEDVKSAAFSTALEIALPYVIVGLLRMDTHDEVLDILRIVTDIDGPINFPKQPQLPYEIDPDMDEFPF